MTDTIQPRRLKKLLRRMIEIYSPSGKEEDILDFLRGYLRRQGLAPVAQPVDQNRFNLIVPPPSGDIRLALIGHIDTVTAYDLETFGYAENGDTIRGLGASDMKGGCAAMIEAFLGLYAAGRSDAPVALCLVVGEEETGDGARQLVRGYQFPWALVGEPTNLTSCFSSFGYLEVQIAAEGRRKHASLAARRENPIETLLQVMLRISHYMEQEQPEVVYNIRDLFSTRSGFAVPEGCEAWLDIHLPPGVPIGKIITELEEVSLQQETGTPVATRFRTATIDAGYELPEKGWLADALRATFDGYGLPYRSMPFQSHSDANGLWAAGVKPVVLGPGELEQAHTEDESISFSQVCRAAELYLGLMRRIFSCV